MLVKNCIQLATTLLQLDICDSVLFTTQVEERQITDNKELMLLVKCANLVQSELAEYFPLKTSDTVEVQNSQIEYTQLSQSIIEVISVTYKGGKIKFNSLPKYLSVSINSGEVNVNYNYRPESVTFYDSLTLGSTKIDERILAYAIASEYCLIKGLYEDASLWDSRYKTALKTISSSSREMVVKSRRWY